MKQVIALILCLHLQAMALKAEPVRCEDTLALCDSYAQALREEVIVLKDSVSKLKDRLAASQSEPIIPTYLLIVGSIAAGMLIGLTIAK